MITRNFVDTTNGGARVARSAAVRGGLAMNTNFALASASLCAIFLIAFVHAPVVPVIAGATLACGWPLWRARRAR